MCLETSVHPRCRTIICNVEGFAWSNSPGSFERTPSLRPSERRPVHNINIGQRSLQKFPPTPLFLSFIVCEDRENSLIYLKNIVYPTLKD